ncbi:hypothetical protein A7X67_13865 [Clostridium sp. W14A]|nr:hypothetical protein A7X67_13865 [Clostridium sp. W14A]
MPAPFPGPASALPSKSDYDLSFTGKAVILTPNGTIAAPADRLKAVRTPGGKKEGIRRRSPKPPRRPGRTVSQQVFRAGIRPDKFCGKNFVPEYDG